ncbi:MAG: right-handed parallel beta-helix repeat-containing protein [Kiritimatiellae bacterium]|nr:right-handed parallel beta-helix repeat-containing protein [Kiritimatiellia bacterium]
MQLSKTRGIAGKYRAARWRLLPALLLCGALTAAAEKQVTTGVRTATFVVAAADSPAQARAQADYVCPGRDDHLAINTAIAALPANGGRVHLAEGTYNIGGVEGTYGGVNILRGNVLLTGAGSGTRLILQGGLTNINVIWISGKDVSDVTVRDLYIDGNGTNLTRSEGSGWAGCNGVKAMPDKNYPKNISVENCHIENCRLMAVMLIGDVVEVLNCYFSGNFGSHVVELLGYNGRIEGCTLNVKDGDSVGFGFSTDACDNYHIINNKVMVAAGGEIRSHAINNWRRCYHGIIAGNMVINNGKARSVRIQGYMDMVHNNIFRGIPVEIQGEGIMFEHNMLINSPLKIDAFVHENVTNDAGGQWPVQISGNWLFNSPISNASPHVIWGTNPVTVTDSAGTLKMAGGTNATVVEHGLGSTPAVVHVNPADSKSDVEKRKVDGLTDRQFTVRVDDDPGSTNMVFYWRAVNAWKGKDGQSVPPAK